jgi:hypothetical protein
MFLFVHFVLNAHIIVWAKFSMWIPVNYFCCIYLVNISNT